MYVKLQDANNTNQFGLKSLSSKFSIITTKQKNQQALEHQWADYQSHYVRSKQTTKHTKNNFCG